MGNSIVDALNVRVEGSGQNFLVLAHGFGTDQSVWKGILPSFTPYYRVILYDLVCAGSVNPDYFDFQRYTTLDSYVDDLLNILDALGVDRCAYVGHSVSAMIGILASIRRPELFTKLILVGASPRLPRRIRAGGDRESVVRNGGKLRRMGAGFRTIGGGSRCPGRGSRIQPDPIQHEARHIVIRFPLHFQQRSEGSPGPSQGTLLHISDDKRRFGPELRRHLSAESSGWAQHGGAARHRGSFAPFERSGTHGGQTPPSTFRLSLHRLLFNFLDSQAKPSIKVSTKWGPAK